MNRSSDDEKATEADDRRDNEGRSSGPSSNSIELKVRTSDWKPNPIKVARSSQVKLQRTTGLSRSFRSKVKVLYPLEVDLEYSTSSADAVPIA